MPNHNLPLFALLFGNVHKPGLMLVSSADAAPTFLIRLLDVAQIIHVGEIDVPKETNYSVVPS
jgi:hypothetical protein